MTWQKAIARPRQRGGEPTTTTTGDSAAPQLEHPVIPARREHEPVRRGNQESPRAGGELAVRIEPSSADVRIAFDAAQPVITFTLAMTGALHSLAHGCRRLAAAHAEQRNRHGADRDVHVDAIGERAR
jgi:hypothetical protein